MNILIVAICVIVAVSGCGVALWSAINTRSKYVEEFTKRKSEREKLRLSR